MLISANYSEMKQSWMFRPGIEIAPVFLRYLLINEGKAASILKVYSIDSLDFENG